MSRYVTLGIDKIGQVYGLELNDDGSWRRNPLGYDTSCVVVRPVSERMFDELTTDADTIRDLWKESINADRTDKGLDEFFEEAMSECGEDGWPCKDESFVYELLDDEYNPAIKAWNELRDREIEKLPDDYDEECPWFDDDGQPMSFRKRVESILEGTHGEDGLPMCDDVPVKTWESAGWWSPDVPFAVELADRGLLDEYYDHLRKTKKNRDDRKEDQE